MGNKPAERVYHGIAEDDAGTHARILVMTPGLGWSDRAGATVLYEITPAEDCWWGYGGSSAAYTARAILQDVWPDVDAGELPESVRLRLTVSLIEDLVGYFHDTQEFWLPARTVARWIRGIIHEKQR